MAKDKQARLCCFCENPANSKEHYYSKWLKREILKPENSVPNVVTQHLVWGRDGVARKGSHFNQGHPVSRSVRSVCTSCNTGWMSRLQDSAKPALLPLTLGCWSSMSPSDFDLISKWATMFSMSIDQVERSLAGFPQWDRYVFKQNKSPPPGWSIRIGLVDDTVMRVWFDHLIATREGLDGDFWGHVTFGRLGRLLVLTSSSRGNEDFQLSNLAALPQFLDKLGMVKIYPSVACSPQMPGLVNESVFQQIAIDIAGTRQTGFFPDWYRTY